MASITEWHSVPNNHGTMCSVEGVTTYPTPSTEIMFQINLKPLMFSVSDVVTQELILNSGEAIQLRDWLTQALDALPAPPRSLEWDMTSVGKWAACSFIFDDAEWHIDVTNDGEFWVGKSDIELIPHPDSPSAGTLLFDSHSLAKAWCQDREDRKNFD